MSANALNFDHTEIFVIRLRVKKSEEDHERIISVELGWVFKPFPKQALVFTCLQDKSFKNTVGKGEIAHHEQFLLFPRCFLPFWRTFCHFHHI